MAIPRPEHPNPQFMRKNWQNLNGVWEFEIDNAKSGIDKKLYLADYIITKKCLNIKIIKIIIMSLQIKL